MIIHLHILYFGSVTLSSESFGLISHAPVYNIAFENPLPRERDSLMEISLGLSISNDAEVFVRSI